MNELSYPRQCQVINLKMAEAERVSRWHNCRFLEPNLATLKPSLIVKHFSKRPLTSSHMLSTSISLRPTILPKTRLKVAAAPLVSLFLMIVAAMKSRQAVLTRRQERRSVGRSSRNTLSRTTDGRASNGNGTEEGGTSILH